jgi:hypothetical protein
MRRPHQATYESQSGAPRGDAGEDQGAAMRNGWQTKPLGELCDVLDYTREVRAANAKVHINTRFSAKQQVFLDFVLSHYVTVGVEELDQAVIRDS